MSIVIVGAGDIGIPLVEIATGSGNEVVVERDEGRAERASRQYDCLVINSDATTKETLRGRHRPRGRDHPDDRSGRDERYGVSVGVGTRRSGGGPRRPHSRTHDTVGYSHVTDFDTPGRRKFSRSYSQQYEPPPADRRQHENPKRPIAEYLYRAVRYPSIVDFVRIGEVAEVFEVVADAPAPQMKHGMVIAAGGWLLVAVVSALPFFLTAWVTPPAVMDTFVPAGSPSSSRGCSSRRTL